MLTRNVAYLDGLANDARVTLVGIVYGLCAVGTPPGAILVEAVRREQRILERAGLGLWTCQDLWLTVL